MKRFLLIIMLTALTAVGFGQTFTNGVYVKNGNTFEVDKKVHQFTTPETLCFSNELIVRTDTNTDFTVNSLFQEAFDLDKPAHKAKFGNSSFAATIMNGSVMVTYAGTNENSSCVISTPMLDLELYKGTFLINVSDNSVVIYVIEGSLKAHGEKKSFIVTNAGNFILAAPNKVGILEVKFSLGVNSIPESAMKKLVDDSKTVTNLRDTYLFVIIDGKIVGVNIN